MERKVNELRQGGCPYIYVKGAKKGTRCNVRSSIGGTFCGQHKKFESSNSPRSTLREDEESSNRETRRQVSSVINEETAFMKSDKLSYPIPIKVSRPTGKQGDEERDIPPKRATKEVIASFQNMKMSDKSSPTPEMKTSASKTPIDRREGGPKKGKKERKVFEPKVIGKLAEKMEVFAHYNKWGNLEFGCVIKPSEIGVESKREDTSPESGTVQLENPVDFLARMQSQLDGSHPKLIFNQDKYVYGVQKDDGSVAPLTNEDIEICKKYNLRYTIDIDSLTVGNIVDDEKYAFDFDVELEEEDEVSSDEEQ